MSRRNLLRKPEFFVKIGTMYVVKLGNRFALSDSPEGAVRVPSRYAAKLFLDANPGVRALRRATT